MTPDRVAEALAALEAAAGARREDWPRSIFPEAQAQVFRAAPALLKLARLWTEPAPYGRQLKALDELAEAVLG